jgi:Spy/CpxP family protein refolding chaperone
MQKSRGWLWLLVPAALGAGLFGFARASASGPFCHGLRGHAPAASALEVEEHLDDKLEHLLDAVDATDAQRRQIAAHVKKVSPEIFALMGEGRALRMELKTALLTDKLDHARIDELRGRIDVLTDKLLDMGMDGLVSVSDVLTPAQRKQVADKLARLHP